LTKSVTYAPGSDWSFPFQLPLRPGEFVDRRRPVERFILGVDECQGHVRGEQAQGVEAGTGGTDGQGVGGGVYNNLGTFSDVFTVIEGNHASTSNDEIFP
jgi:hypothetical protein